VASRWLVRSEPGRFFTVMLAFCRKANSYQSVVKVRVFWDSPQGVQKIDVQDFIYNYSENL
jgi:hypothetical protein